MQGSASAAILTALIASLFRSEGGSGGGKRVALGVAAGIALAIAFASLRLTAIPIKREYLNIAVLALTLAVELFFCLFLWNGFGSHRRISAARSASGATLIALSLLYSLPAVILQPQGFAMNAEGFFSTDFVFKVALYLAGIILTAFSSYALYKTGQTLPFATMRRLVTAALAIAALGQAVVIVLALLARRILPMRRWLFNAIVQMVNNYAWFLYAFVALALFVPVLQLILSRHSSEPFANPAEHRKLRAATRRRRRWSACVLAGYAASLLSVTALRAYSERETALSPPEPLAVAEEELSIPLEAVDDGHLHRFAYKTESGVEVRFIVIKKNQSAYGVGLDACDICGPTGYYERGNQVVCKMCDVVMNVATIGFKGGCNPVPLAYSIRDGRMLVQKADLEAEKKRFQ